MMTIYAQMRTFVCTLLQSLLIFLYDIVTYIIYCFGANNNRSSDLI